MGNQSVIRYYLSAVRGNFRHRKFAYFRLAIFTLLAACLTLTAAAQPEDESWKETAPPPLKVLSKTEKSQLSNVNDIKQRTKLALELMEARLVKAEALNAQENFPEMFNELGGFHAVVDDTLDFLNRNNNNSGKVLNNFKRIEMSLRKYITRLEIIRRDLPIKYELYVRKLVGHIRNARSKAVEPLFDDTVLPNTKP